MSQTGRIKISKTTILKKSKISRQTILSKSLLFNLTTLAKAHDDGVNSRLHKKSSNTSPTRGDRTTNAYDKKKKRTHHTDTKAKEEQIPREEKKFAMREY